MARFRGPWNAKTKQPWTVNGGSMVIDSFLRKPIILQRPPVRVAYESVGQQCTLSLRAKATAAAHSDGRGIEEAVGSGGIHLPRVYTTRSVRSAIVGSWLRERSAVVPGGPESRRPLRWMVDAGTEGRLASGSGLAAANPTVAGSAPLKSSDNIGDNGHPCCSRDRKKEKNLGRVAANSSSRTRQTTARQHSTRWRSERLPRSKRSRPTW